jgi:hypothetical protein
VKPTQRATLSDDVATCDRHAPTPHHPSYVITLCSAPVPISIPRPRSPQLARFSFFSSTRNDERHERYWVHMGYFSTRAEAQRLLNSLLSEYPRAFISDARSLESNRHCARHADREVTPAVRDVASHVEASHTETSATIKSH